MKQCIVTSKFEVFKRFNSLVKQSRTSLIVIYNWLDWDNVVHYYREKVKFNFIHRLAIRWIMIGRLMGGESDDWSSFWSILLPTNKTIFSPVWFRSFPVLSVFENLKIKSRLTSSNLLGTHIDQPIKLKARIWKF